jgi:hypothetical protein
MRVLLFLKHISKSALLSLSHGHLMAVGECMFASSQTRWRDPRKHLFLLHGGSAWIVTPVQLLLCIAMLPRVRRGTETDRQTDYSSFFFIIINRDLLHGDVWVIWWGHSGRWDSAQCTPRQSRTSRYGVLCVIGRLSFIRLCNKNRLSVGRDLKQHRCWRFQLPEF